MYATRLRAQFRGLTTRDGVLLRGDAGWGEFSPFWDYDAVQSRSWLAAAREAADEGWPPALRASVPVNVTVPAVSPARAHELVRASRGCLTAKVKVAEPGEDLGAEQARLEAVREALGPEGKIRIDANGAWTLGEALARLPALDRAAGGLEYVEQPCREVADLAKLRRSQNVRVAADESIRRAEDPLVVVRAEAADVVVMKVQPLGGVRPALALAERLGLPVVVSSAIETSVGIAAGLALAAALPELPFACGLATVQLLEHDVVDEPLLPVDGALAVGRPPPRLGALARAAADAEKERRWRGRLREVAEAREANTPAEPAR